MREGKFFQISPPPNAPELVLLLYTQIRYQVLQFVLHACAYLYQLMSVDQ